MADPTKFTEAESAFPLRPWLAAWAHCWREITRFLRQPNRVIGALGQPILFWVLFGAGLDRSFQISPTSESGQSFFAYYVPGTLVLIVLFTAIFSTISLIEDRREGFLQSVLIAPAPRWSMVLGKVSGGALLALGQAVVFLLLCLTIGIEVPALTWLLCVLLLGVVSFGLASFGFILAWRMESTQGFHAIMNLLLMPMWLLSGAFFPIPSAEGGLGSVIIHWLMRINPLSYPMAALRRWLYEGSREGQAAIDHLASSDSFWLPDQSLCLLLTVLFTVGAFAGACRISRGNTRSDLQ